MKLFIDDKEKQFAIEYMKMLFNLALMVVSIGTLMAVIR